MRLMRRLLWLAPVAALCGCGQPRIVEDTPMAVSVRYDGLVQSLAAATDAAQHACAARGRTAHLRATETMGIAEHYAHFDCVER